MFPHKVLPLSPNEVIVIEQAPTLSYMLFVHRNKLRSRDKGFTQKLSLTESKLYVTDTLITETKKHLYVQRRLDDLATLNREQLFCNYLKKKVKHMLAWKEMCPEERMQIKQAVIAIRKGMESQANQEQNCAKRQKLDYGSEFSKTESVQHTIPDDQCCEMT
uniref:Uncharacterized protein n=1 Tax=Bactrocera latifrons TaxID=174628 RepID=A0A0K8VNB7_BACLA